MVRWPVVVPKSPSIRNGAGSWPDTEGMSMRRITFLLAMALPLLLLTAGKVMTVTYNPFLYFRF